MSTSRHTLETASASEKARVHHEDAVRWDEANDFEHLRTLSDTIAADLSLTAVDLQWLSNLSSAFVRQGVAKNPNAAPDLLRKMSYSVVPLIREAVASNPFVPSEVLTALALRDHDRTVLAAVASHPVTAPEALMLVAVASASYVEVRVAVASNHACDTGTLIFLADDENEEVLTAVAKHPNSPAPLREALHELLNL